MTPSDDLSPLRRPLFFPVVIATVFLTIIGMTGGFVLGERHRERLRAAEPGQTSTGKVVGAPSPESTAASRPYCPEETLATADSLGFSAELRRELKIVTENGTTVWICEDPAGALFYQGKTGGVDAPLVQKTNGLFLSDVHRSEDRKQYVANAPDGNRILVTADRLEVRYASGKNQISKVVTVE